MATALWRLTLTLLVMVASVMVAQAAPSPTTCPARCVSCVNGVAECSKRSLVTPPKNFPPDTRKIIMDNNHLRVLGTRSFQQLNNMEVLRLKGNKVRVVKKAAFKKLPKLMTLDLSNNQLVKIYSKGFDGMKQLQTLSLQYNRIRSISRIFDTTPKLFQLNLAFNKIRSIGKNDLRTPTRVHYLDLRNNRISKINPMAFVHMKYLRYLFLNKNPLVTVPGLTMGSHVLQLVDFSNCRLTHVPKTMPQSVTDFRLNDNKIMQINDTDFTNMTNLRLLALNNNQLHFVANKAFAHLGQLDEIWLRNNKLVYIPRNLPDNLRKLYMDSNKIQVIEDGLFTNESRLHYLTVENNKIHSIHNTTFKGLRFLKSLNFRGNKLKVIEPGTFQNLRNLSTLSLSNNPLERVEPDSFLNLDNLTYLHLDMCGEQTALEQNFLEQMPNLQKLTIMNSPGLGKAFTAMLASSSQTMTPLKRLTEIDLTYNDLHTLTPNVQELFPSLDALAVDGNSWLCDKRLVWLRRWMVNSDVSFSKYEPVICERPYALKGQEIRDLEDRQFVEVAATPEPPSPEEYAQMMARRQGIDSSTDNGSANDKALSANTNSAPSAVKAGPSLPSGNTAPKTSKPKSKRRRRKQRQNGRKQRKARGKGRKRRGKKGKGKGRKRRDRRGRKTDQQAMRRTAG